MPDPPPLPAGLTLVIALIALWLVFRHGRRLLLGLLGVAVALSLWRDSSLSAAVAPIFNELLGPLLTLAIVGIGLRIMLRPFTRCADCGCRRCDCDCHHHHCHRRDRSWW